MGADDHASATRDQLVSPSPRDRLMAATSLQHAKQVLLDCRDKLMIDEIDGVATSDLLWWVGKLLRQDTEPLTDDEVSTCPKNLNQFVNKSTYEPPLLEDQKTPDKTPATEAKLDTVGMETILKSNIRSYKVLERVLQDLASQHERGSIRLRLTRADATAIRPEELMEALSDFLSHVEGGSRAVEVKANQLPQGLAELVLACKANDATGIEEKARYLTTLIQLDQDLLSYYRQLGLDVSNGSVTPHVTNLQEIIDLLGRIAAKMYILKVVAPGIPAGVTQRSGGATVRSVKIVDCFAQAKAIETHYLLPLNREALNAGQLLQQLEADSRVSGMLKPAIKAVLQR